MARFGCKIVRRWMSRNKNAELLKLLDKASMLLRTAPESAPSTVTGRAVETFTFSGFADL